jgi:MFS family permease
MAGLSALLGLIACQVFLHASMAGLRMATSLYVLRAGGDELGVGPVVSMFSVAPLLLALPAGRLTDRLGYHAPLRIAVALTSTGALLALCTVPLAAARYPLLCLAALAAGAGANVGLIAIQRTAGRTARGSTELKRVFSWLGMAPSMSNVLGPSLAGLLIDHVGFTAAFATLAALPWASLVVSRAVPRESASLAPAGPRRPATDLLAGAAVRRLLFVSWLMSASWDLHSFLVPVLGEQRGFSASAIGAILATFAAAVTTVRFVIPVLAHRLSERAVLMAAMVSIALTFAAYPLAQATWAMGLCAALLGFALGSSQPMVLAALHHVTPADRQGEALALRAITSNASSAVLPMVFGAVGGMLGAPGLFWTMGALVSAGSLVARRVGR